MKKAQKFICFFIVLSLMGFINTVFAQESEDDEFTLEEIVVTAENREQSIQDVSISINVLTPKQIERLGVNDLRSLHSAAPDFVAIYDQNITTLSMRGISTLSNDEAQDQSLTVNIDGEFINRGRVLNLGIFDLERIEVLRGPQGSLYGRNTTAGAVNIITRKPEIGEFSGNISLDFGDYDTRKINAAINIPLGDIAAMRLSGFSNERDGYSTHPNFNGQDSGDVNTLSGRFGLKVEPSDALSIFLAGETASVDNLSNTYASIDFNQAPYQANPDGGINCSGTGWEYLQDVDEGGIACVPTNVNYLHTIDPDNYQGPITGTLGSVDIGSDAFRGRVDYDFGGATLTYQGGYRDSDVVLQDALPDYIFYRYMTFTTTSHELRLSGENESGLFWQGGVFYFNEEITLRGGLFSPFLNFVPGSVGAFINGFIRPDFKSKSLAFFGQTEIPFGDFDLVLGARYTKDDKSSTFINQGFGFVFGDPADLRPIDPDTDDIFFMDFDDDAFTGNVGLNWNIDEDTMLYGKMSTGYRAGGFDSVGRYESETVNSYEIGYKVKGRRMTWNSSAFYSDYEDLQASVLIDTTVGGQIFNAGDVTIWGVETSVDYWPTDVDNLTFSANYLNAEYNKFDISLPVQCVGCDLNALPGSVSGNTPPNAPDWIFTLGYNRGFDLPNGGTLTGSIFSRFKSSYYTTVFNYAGGEQDSYTQTDLTLEYRTPKGAFSVLAYLRNIEDERQVTYSTFISAGPSDAYNYSFGAPRTVGLQLKYNF